MTERSAEHLFILFGNEVNLSGKSKQAKFGVSSVFLLLFGRRSARLNHFFQQVELDPGLRLVLRQRDEVQLQQRRAHDGLVFNVHGRNETFQQNKMISKIQTLPK